MRGRRTRVVDYVIMVRGVLYHRYLSLEKKLGGLNQQAMGKHGFKRIQVSLCRPVLNTANFPE